MSVFVTVGTTSFDTLIDEINNAGTHAALSRLGYQKLIVQYGAGRISPVLPKASDVETAYRSLSLNFSNSRQLDQPKLLQLDIFRFSNNLDTYFSQCDLVISHGGAGTCLEALTPPGARKLVIVTNDKLMNGHQSELASTLYEKNHALFCTPSSLVELLWTGLSPEMQRISSKVVASLTCQKNVAVLGPQVTAKEAGFTPFSRGKPGPLIDYLNTKLALKPQPY